LVVGALFIVGLILLGSDLGLVTDCLAVLTDFPETGLLAIDFSVADFPGTALALVVFPLAGAADLIAAFFCGTFTGAFAAALTGALTGVLLDDLAGVLPDALADVLPVDLLLTAVLVTDFAAAFAGDFITGFFPAGLLVLTGAFAADFFAGGFALLAATGFLAALATGLPADLDWPAGLDLTEVLLAALTAGLAVFLTNAFGFAVFFVAIFVFLLRRCFNTHGFILIEKSTQDHNLSPISESALRYQIPPGSAITNDWKFSLSSQ
jgi:hypothetical protein